MTKHTAKDQIDQDFKAATETFALDLRNTDPMKLFCLGITMAVLTLRGYAENEDLWPQGSQGPDDAIDKYYEAARKKIHNS